jgi:methyl-accepting chemotaxis protein
MIRPHRFGALRAAFSSVFVRCAGIMAFTKIVVVAVMAVQSARLTGSLAHQGVVDMADRTVSLKAAALVAPLRFNSVPKIEEVVEEAMRAAGDNGIAAIVVNAEGAVVVASDAEAGVIERMREAALAQLDGDPGVAAPGSLLLTEVVRTEADGPAIGALTMLWSDAAAMAQVSREKNLIMLWAAGTFVVMMGLTLLMLRRFLGSPLASLSASVERVADGDYDSESGLNARGDEIGQIARHLDDLLVRLREGRDAEAAQEIRHKEQGRVVAALGDALTALAQGDLSTTLAEPFPDEYERLRTDYNRAVDSLLQVVREVNGKASSVGTGASEISQSTDDLSRRTENQAATLEQTSASLEELLTSVKSAASNAAHADEAVRNAREMVVHNGTIMTQAVQAMSAIEKSSGQISDIISVIDDIAFQTNLLALNAGVEAARAGSSGKGFAVVASEVRALAQRSSEAARQIKDLIVGSAEEVKSGVRLVEDAGTALDGVIEKVGAISDLVAGISTTASEQAQGLNEINSGVSSLDTVTQKNAAMVEETTAAAHMLRNEAAKLGELMARFKLEQASTRKTQAPQVHAQQTPLAKSA